MIYHSIRVAEWHHVSDLEYHRSTGRGIEPFFLVLGLETIVKGLELKFDFTLSVYSFVHSFVIHYLIVPIH